VTYPESSVFCESNTQSATIQHVVTLGVFCTDLPPDDPYYFLDTYFECAELTDLFDELTDDTIFNSTTNRHGCSASKTFAPLSSSSNPQTISSVAITTDDLWLSRMDDTCYTQYVSAAPVPMTNAPVPPSPTVTNTANLFQFPTLQPMDALSSPPMNLVPAAAEPIQPRATTPTIPGK
jgi:hypothetical protein